VQQIKRYIRVHRIKPGEKLPTVRALSDHFQMTRDATWRALQELKREGWIRDLHNRRYTIADGLYNEILQNLKVRALFSGKNYILFTGFRRLADALNERCLDHGLDLSITLLPLDESPTNSIWQDCDVLLVDSDSSRPLLKYIANFPVPVIGMDADYSDRYHTNIVTDHQLGGRLAAERLIQKGSGKVSVLFFRGSGENPRIKARIQGFQHAWIEAGRAEGSVSTAEIGWSSIGFQVALNVHEYLKRHEPLSDFFVTDGHLAISCLEVLSYMGIEVPNKVKLIGYDGAQMGEMTDPPMTAIQQDMSSLAEAVIKCISYVARKSEKRGEIIRIPPVLINRVSC
jgi:DNA-binding LacI/PurR family transcriptional regulator